MAHLEHEVKIEGLAELVPVCPLNGVLAEERMDGVEAVRVGLPLDAAVRLHLLAACKIRWAHTISGDHAPGHAWVGIDELVDHILEKLVRTIALPRDNIFYHLVCELVNMPTEKLIRRQR